MILYIHVPCVAADLEHARNCNVKIIVVLNKIYAIKKYNLDIEVVENKNG